MLIIKCLIIVLLEVFVASRDITNEYQSVDKHDNRLKRLIANNNTTHPGDPYNPEKPNFFKSAKRVSEAKCFEYIWELKERAVQAKRILEFTYAVGGRDTESGEFPHMGALGWKAVAGTWIFKCGSTLISDKYLLTAAHCSRVSSADTTVANRRPEIVRLGDKNIIDTFANGQSPKDVNIKRIVNHPNYKSPEKYFDIAIVELEQPVTFTKYIQPACLWTDFDTKPLGRKATLTGWGVIETGGKTTSPELQAAVVDFVDSDLCNNLLRPSCSRLWCGLQSHQICAGKLAGGVDACQGDSGGPLQVKISLPITTQGSMHHIIGVTSFGIGCARPNLPGIYTRVSSFIDWIEDVVWRGLSIRINKKTFKAKIT